jgi:uncharacterized protein involved in exopolysaccharide biosynthesis
MDTKIENAENKPGFAGDFALRNATEIGISYMKIYTELETFAKVKAFLMPNLEEAKLKEIKNIKNLFIVDEAIPPNKKDRPKRSVIVAGSAIGTFSIIVIGILLINSFKNFRRKYKNMQLD